MTLGNLVDGFANRKLFKCSPTRKWKMLIPHTIRIGYANRVIDPERVRGKYLSSSFLNSPFD